jgi:hypothetical protein
MLRSYYHTKFYHSGSFQLCQLSAASLVKPELLNPEEVCAVHGLAGLRQSNHHELGEMKMSYLICPKAAKSNLSEIIEIAFGLVARAASRHP